MRFHHEVKEDSVYALSIAKSGVRMHEVNCVPFDPNNLPKQVALSEQERHSQCGGIHRNLGELEGQGMSMADSAGPAFQSLAGQLPLILDRPVIDRTGLTGRFDVHLRWASDQPTGDSLGQPATGGAKPSPDMSGHSIFTALQEQLGLKLEASKGPVEKFVIDHAERPDEN